MSHIERRKREKEKVKKDILDAALNLAVTEGWNAVTIRKIADAIEYTPPIVYEHYKNKDDLLNALVVRGHHILVKSNNLSLRKESDPRKVLMMLSENFWNFAFKHKELYELMFSLNRQIPGEKALYSLVQKITGKFEQLTGNEKLAQEAMFSWMCFQQGYIYNVKQMGLPAPLANDNPKKLFRRAIIKYIADI